MYSLECSQQTQQGFPIDACNDGCYDPFASFSCSMICLLQYRLGKNLPGSGNFVLCSLSALKLNTTAHIPKMTPPIIAVLDFQFPGFEYHPPAGDQTCFGYGIFPPEPCDTAAPAFRSAAGACDSGPG